jgi:geranylgeranyl diphosphate synthase type I
LLRYHLGFVNQTFQPARSDPGKRIRPRVCVLSSAACGGNADDAIHMAAAIELLHNFTLIHDDIQDQSDLRRHRPTVWSLWGIPQAINAGDAMFAVAHLALNRSLRAGLDPATVLELSTALHQTTLRIVEGQVMDLGFEGRQGVTADEYMRMIGGKTAAIYRCACWSGAIIAGASAETAALLGEFGYAVGNGFQLRDDVLGIWGSTVDTGKTEADDIRRRKKSFPILLLRDLANSTDRAKLDALYQLPDIPPKGVAMILAMLRHYEVDIAAQETVQHWHDRAATLLDSAVPANQARARLESLVEKLGSRTA